MQKTLFSKYSEIIQKSIKQFSKSTCEKLISSLVVDNGYPDMVNAIYDLLQKESATEKELLTLMEELKQNSPQN